MIMLLRMIQSALIGLIGICSVQAQMADQEMALAKDLATEEDWKACRQECLRVEHSGVPHDEAKQLRELAEQHLAGPAKSQGSWWTYIGAFPVKAMVGFYRLMVAPALGSRCSLEPSCSRYSMQAARERGWLGLPMTADRLIREPSVVMARENPVTNFNGRVHFSDPVSAHIGGTGRLGGR